MTNEKILAEEKLEEVQLDAVAGGTVGELEDLAGAMLDKYRSSTCSARKRYPCRRNFNDAPKGFKN